MRIILLRHAESEANIAGDNSDHPETKITKTGHEQAKKAANFLYNNSKCYSSSRLLNIKYILSSPFTRTLETAEQVAKKLKLKAISCDELCEGSNGIIDGIKFNDIKNIPKVGLKLQKLDDDLEKMHKSGILNIDKKFQDTLEKFEKRTGAEKGKDIYKRVNKLIKKYATINEQVDNKRICDYDILIVSHGGTIKEYIANMFNIHSANIGSNFAISSQKSGLSNGKEIKNCHISNTDRY